MAAPVRTEAQPEEQAATVAAVSQAGVSTLDGAARVQALQRAIGNRATARLIADGRTLARRSVHSDKDLLNMMKKFRSKNDHLSEAEQNKIFWSVKKATGSDEVAWKFFDYYSGYLGAGYKIKKMDGTQLANARKKQLLAETKANDDTYLDPDVLSLPDESLGPLLLHEFAHTGHDTNFLGNSDFQEGQAYAVEYFYAEHTGDTARMTKIIDIISTAKARYGANQEAATKEHFRVTYVLMTELAKLTHAGSSTLRPLIGKSGGDGRLMTADFVAGLSALSADLQALWDHIKANLSSFTFPAV